MQLTMYSRSGCHLCDDARAMVLQVLDEFPGVSFDERSILDDAELFDAYVEEIPVLLIDDRVHTIWRVDPERLRRRLEEVTA